MANVVKNIDEYVDNLLAENGALRRKLQSKAEALLILSKELDTCRRERDQFQMMAEQLQIRLSTIKKKSLALGDSPLLSCETVEDRSKTLRLETEELRQQLRDAYGDLKALRAQLAQIRAAPVRRDESSFPAHQKQEMLEQLEAMSIKTTQLKRDLQALLDEKEELILQRDSLRSKVHRLNHELHQALALPSSASSEAQGASGGQAPVSCKVDLDALITENAYLHERVSQSEQEKELAAQSITKYKSMLDKKRSKGAIKLGAHNNSGLVISHKQVQQLLSRSASSLPVTAAAVSDLRSLCLALLEALGDKGTALTHQKRTTRVLGRRVAELERRLSDGGGTVFPSRVLLAGYATTDVDRQVDQILAAAELEQAQEQQQLLEQDGAAAAATGKEVCVDVDDEDEDSLPPQLQQMVLKALEDIRKEAALSNNDTSNNSSPL